MYPAALLLRSLSLPSCQPAPLVPVCLRCLAWQVQRPGSAVLVQVTVQHQQLLVVLGGSSDSWAALTMPLPCEKALRPGWRALGTHLLAVSYTR